MPEGLIPAEELMKRGESIYGAQAFAQIYGHYLALQPFMSDSHACLEALASPLERLIKKGQANKERLQSPGIGMRIGNALLRNLGEYAARVNRNSAVMPVSVEPKDLTFQIEEALKDAGFSVKGSHRAELPVPPNYGRRPYTGQTEQPGPNPGYSPASRP